jgi:hypothetical protein
VSSRAAMLAADSPALPHQNAPLFRKQYYVPANGQVPRYHNSNSNDHEQVAEEETVILANNRDPGSS